MDVNANWQSGSLLGAFSVVRDPQGAVFTIVQFSEPAATPPGA